MKNIVYIGEKSNMDFGVVVTKLPDVQLAAERGEWVQVQGRSGEVFVSGDALEDVTIPLPIWIPPGTDMAGISRWIRGERRIRVEGWPWFWVGRLMSTAALPACVGNDGWSATLMFKCQPHRYVWPEADPITLTSSKVIQNPANAESLPLITVSGSGDVTLMINDTSVLLLDVAESVVLDCDAKTARTISGTQATGQIKIYGGWPRLTPGNNAINWTGSVTSVKITPRWRNE